MSKKKYLPSLTHVEYDVFRLIPGMLFLVGIILITLNKEHPDGDCPITVRD